MGPTPALQEINVELCILAHCPYFEKKINGGLCAHLAVFVSVDLRPSPIT
jgi:hypothetical protein